MGLDVSWVRVVQPGSGPRRRRYEELATVLDSDELFAQICEKSTSPMLARADPYGSLHLSSSEMEQLVEELGRATVGTTAERALVRTVRDLALRCRSEPGTELHLDGD
ncbi:hypothetical protein [Cellulosimicrobium sp. Marseille-Q8652]